MENNYQDLPTNDEVEKYDYLSPMLDSALAEMREFAKKKQDGIVSATKIKLLNRLLKDVKAILSKEESSEYLDLLSEDELPQNSDAVLILGQYRAALNSFKKKHHRYIYGDHKWATKELMEEMDKEESEYDKYDENEMDDSV